MALGVKKGLAAAVEAGAVEEEEEEESNEAPDMAKGLLLSGATPTTAPSAFLAPATRASKLTSAELAPRKSSGDRLGLPPEP